MKWFKPLTVSALLLIFVSGCSQNYTEKPMKYTELTPEETDVILHKGTEKPYSGKFFNYWEDGTYTCKRCGYRLYQSSAKFDAGCGWPSFDEEIPGAVKRVPDADQYRIEIVCANCGAHLGHVFEGEEFTDKNTRHCVNSISMNFIPLQSKGLTEKAFFAGGCFWGVEYYLQKAPGVIAVESGYIGGRTENPTYQEVCSGNTGHYEAVEVIFDPFRITFVELARLFFEIHDPTQWNHQGPDRGDQYRSAVFYNSEEQRTITEQLIRELKDNGYNIVTEVKPAGKFWKAEQYHQDYYERKGSIPYCHGFTKRFTD